MENNTENEIIEELKKANILNPNVTAQQIKDAFRTRLAKENRLSSSGSETEAIGCNKNFCIFIKSLD